MRELIRRGLEKTAELFPEVRIGFGWVHRVARLLDNPGGLPGEKVKKRLRDEMRDDETVKKWRLSV